MTRKPIFSLAFSTLLIAALFLAGCQPATPTPVSPPTSSGATNIPQIPPTSAPATLEPTQVAPANTEASSTAASIQPKSGGTLVWGLEVGDPETLDPTLAGGLWTSWFGSSLVDVDAKGNIVPYLAEKWEISQDGLVYTFHLKKGVKFHDGTPMTAQDFVWTYKRGLQPDTNAGALQFFLGNVDKIEAPDDYTLVMTLKSPFAAFLYNLSNAGFMQPLPRKAYESDPDFGKHPIGVGPFMFKDWLQGDHITLVRNPDFNWGPSYAHSGPPYIDTLVMRVIPEHATLIAGIESGEVQEGNIDVTDLKRVQESGIVDVVEFMRWGLYPTIVLNVSKPPFDNVDVRRAFNLATDREALVQVLYSGYAQTKYGPLTPENPGYWAGIEALGWHYDLARAKQLLEKAGYTPGSDGILQKGGVPLKLTLYTDNGENFQKYGEMLLEQYKQLGVDISLQMMESGVLADTLAKGDFEMTLSAFDWYEGGELLRLVYQLINYGKISDPELDQLFAQSQSTLDPNKRQEVINNIVKRIVDRSYTIDLVAYSKFLAYSKNLGGVEWNQNSWTPNMFDVFYKN